eukprot:TRINITY_DN12626_c0_g1_i1.p2 TRINITY_DN12626_c0_g1~~TRINITY_DN12626_c0_g1_i1.p2  ORF type:complete len:210 (-),score=17.92 TRINITY_DN12626_c0_g1_i1:164-760(-)
MQAFLREYEGPASEEYDHGKFPSVSCSLSWSLSGPSAGEVPMSGLCQATPRQEQSPDEQRNNKGHVISPPDVLRNPMPSTGSRRDACGCLSIGSEGHESGRCAGPCMNVRSGRGCTYGKKCKLCHLPHPEVSSTSIRKQQRAKVKMLREAEMLLASSVVDATQQTEQLAQTTAGEWCQRQQKDRFARGQLRLDSRLSL